MSKEVICWTIAMEGKPIPFYVNRLRKDAIEAFNNNIIGDETLADYQLYKAVKIAIRVLP